MPTVSLFSRMYIHPVSIGNTYNNTMSDKVSVIIPTYNYARFIEDCLNSVLSQTYKNLEIIVVDDGSTDNTKEVLSAYGDKIKYIYQENSGLSASRNTGIKNATGKYIQFLDSDDFLHPKSIEHRVQFLTSNPSFKIAVCRNKFFYGYSKIIKNLLNRGWYLHRENLDIHHLYVDSIAPTHAFLFDSEVIEKVGFFDTSLKVCEDYDYWLKVLQKGYIPHYCRKGVVYHRIHKESMSQDKINMYYHNAILHLKLYDKFFVSKKISTSNNIAGSIAFLCGLLTTINRLEGKNTHIQDKLQKIVEPYFENVFNCLNRGEGGSNFEMSFYLIRLYNIVNKYYKNNDAIYGRLVSLLDKSGTVNQILISSLISTKLNGFNKLVILYEYLRGYKI